MRGILPNKTRLLCSFWALWPQLQTETFWFLFVLLKKKGKKIQSSFFWQDDKKISEEWLLPDFQSLVFVFLQKLIFKWNISIITFKVDTKTQMCHFSFNILKQTAGFLWFQRFLVWRISDSDGTQPTPPQMNNSALSKTVRNVRRLEVPSAGPRGGCRLHARRWG